MTGLDAIAIAELEKHMKKLETELSSLSEAFQQELDRREREMALIAKQFNLDKRVKALEEIVEINKRLQSLR